MTDREIDPASPRIRPGVEIHDVEDGAVVYQPETDGVHFLNYTASQVLLRCDGSHSPERIDMAVGALCAISESAGLSRPILEEFVSARLINWNTPES